MILLSEKTGMDNHVLSKILLFKSSNGTNKHYFGLMSEKPIMIHFEDECKKYLHNVFSLHKYTVDSFLLKAESTIVKEKSLFCR